MALSLERRVEVLEEKMENLETNAGPGRADAQSDNLTDLRRQFTEFGAVQAQQAQSLDVLNGKFNSIELNTGDCQFRLLTLESSLRGFKNESSGKLDRLDHNFTWLKGQFTSDDGLLVGLSSEMVELRDDVTVVKTDVAELKQDVTVLKTDMAELKDNVTVLEVKVDKLKTDVSELKADVSELKADVSELKADVSELKADVIELKTGIKEILDRLPTKAA